MFVEKSSEVISAEGVKIKHILQLVQQHNLASPVAEEAEEKAHQQLREFM